MLKEVKTRAQFLNPIQHEEKLTHFSGMRTEWFIEGIVFNIDECDYSAADDTGFTMHSADFSDGSSCYFEVLTDGTLSHFMVDAYAEFRDGLLVVSARSVYEATKAKRAKFIADHVPKDNRKDRKARSAEED